MPVTERYSRTQFAPISNQEMRVPSGALSDDFKELVRTRTDIVQLVGERVALQSRHGGRELVGLCPFHDDHEPSLRVNPERQSYKCWACGEGGDCFTFVQKTENVEFRDALELLATRANLELPRYGKGDGKNSDGKPTRKEQLDALDLGRGRISHVPADVERRGRRPRVSGIARLYAGVDRAFSPGFRAGRRAILTKACGRSFQIVAGDHGTACHGAADCRTCGRGRILRLFPRTRDVPHPRPFRTHCCVRGTRFAGRRDQSGEICQQRRERAFREEPRSLRFRCCPRSAIVERDAAVVMEGYADCIMAHQFGITNAVATLGTALTENHVSALKRFTRKVILVFDGDKAGKDAAEKSLPRFLSQEVDLRILTLTSEKDPADFLIAQGAEPFQKLLETAVEAWEYKLRLLIERNGLDSVDARDQVVTEMLELFRLAPGFGGSARENIVLNRLAFRVGLSESQIREMFVTSRRKADQAAASNGRSKSCGGRIETNDNTAGENAAVNANSHQTKLEGELLEIVFIDPTAIDVLRTEIAVDDFQHEHYRRLLAICYRLSEEGKQPSYDNIMSAVEDPILIRLVVTLERSAQSKAPKLRLDCAVDEPGSRHALLVKLIGLLKRRADARDASLDRMAIQSGLAGGNPAQATPAGTLDAAQREMLRRATGIHSQRAGRRAAGIPRARERENELNLEDSHVQQRPDDKLSELIAIGKGQGGWLTFSQVNDYLPDEAVNPEKLDMLLMSIEELGMEIVADKKLPYKPPEKKRGKNGKKGKEGGEEKSRRIDDPVRMYLTQMGEIPLLTREQEISLAKKIEVTRKRFRRQLLECDYPMKAAIDILSKVNGSELPFDRTIKVSVTEGLDKGQITGRMPHNLKTLDYLRKKNIADFEKMKQSGDARKGAEVGQPRAGRASAEDGHVDRRDERPHAAAAAVHEAAEPDLVPHDRAREPDRAPETAQVGQGRAGQSAAGTL